MTTIPTSRAAERSGSKSFPSRSRWRGGARCKAFAAVVAAALVACAGVAVAGLPRVFESVSRIALVIGNGDYVHNDDLRTPRNEAAAMAAALERLGFRVRHLEDAGYLDMLQGLLEFSQEAQSADAAVVFYAGHGGAVDGRNYLAPVDVRPEESLGLNPLTWLMRSVAGASDLPDLRLSRDLRGASDLPDLRLSRDLRLVILDTYVGAPLEPAGGSIVAAAAVGTFAVEDTEGSAHSPYTEALLRYLEEPGLELGMLFRKVREDVMRATDGRQEPVVYGLPGWSVYLGSLSGQTPEVDPRDPREAAKPERGEAETGFKIERDDAEKAAPPQAPGTTFRDCPECPEMVVVPSGSFQMGSPESEEGRNDLEGPVHEVTIARPFAAGVHEVTRGEFARFVSATGRSMGNACFVYEGGQWEKRSGRHWKSPGFRQTDDHPVVCVNWEDAQAYVQWLSRKTGEEYRLLSEAEWEYVARAGTKTTRYWGESERGQCRYANGADEALKRRHANWERQIASCDDGHAKTAPVGSYDANGYGLHDVLGNVWEWTEDCWNDSYAGAPRDGSAWTSGDCSRRVLRGGSWNNFPGNLRSASRVRDPSGGRINLAGFRVARTLTP